MYKKLAFDVDGVLADFTAHYVEHYNIAHPNEKISKADITDYSFRNLPYQDKLWHTPGFIRNVPLMEKAMQCFTMIAHNFETIIVTDVPVPQQHERISWFAEHFPFFPKENIFFTPQKDRVDFDVIFEDSPFNIDSIGEKRSIRFAHEYNKVCAPCITTVSNWDEILQWVSKNCTPISQPEKIYKEAL